MNPSAITETRFRVLVQNEADEIVEKEIRGSTIEILREDIGITDVDATLYVYIDSTKNFVKLKGKKELALLKDGVTLKVVNDKKKGSTLKFLSGLTSKKEPSPDASKKKENRLTLWFGKKNKKEDVSGDSVLDSTQTSPRSRTSSPALSARSSREFKPTTPIPIFTSVINQPPADLEPLDPKWEITSEEKSEYQKLFEEFDVDGTGFLTVDNAKELFAKFNLPSDLIAKIWSLSDIDEDRRLDTDEFTIARYLIKLHNLGDELPNILPDGFLQLINPIFLTYRKSSAVMQQEDDLDRLRASRGRSNAFYSGSVTDSPPRKLSRIRAGLAEMEHVVLPEESSSLLISSSKRPKKFIERRVIGESSRFNVGIADTIGRRNQMEDEIIIHGHFCSKEDQDFFAVYDGHGGKAASDYASKRLHKVLEEKLKVIRDPEQALRTAFQETNEEMKKENIQGGTTAISALFIGNYGFIANLGDSRAVLCEDGKAIRYSTDHKPDLPEEEKRIRELGGHITTTIDKLGRVTSRVCGRLAVTRALGDFMLQPYVSCDPQVRGPIVLSPSTQFLILACDGLWDRVTDEEAVAIVGPIEDPEIAAKRLRDYAYYEGSDDNISVVVIRFLPVET